MKPRGILGGLLAPIVLLAVVPVPANAYPRPGATERVSVAFLAGDGAQANFPSHNPSISADGRYVAFVSGATNLVPGGDTNVALDVFVRDRATGTNERVSVASDGAQADSQSTAPAISADGRFVAFVSGATNLVPGGDTNGDDDVFVRDRATGTNERVSVASDGAQADSQSTAPAISADGRFVAFVSTASNLVPGGDTNGDDDVFVHDRATGTTERVSVASDGAQADSQSTAPAISADGGYVAFGSTASNLVPLDTNGRDDVFVHDRATGTTERVSVASDAAQANAASSAPAISADGGYVAFGSAASNLVPGDANGQGDVFLRDRQAGTTERVSVSSAGAEGSQSSAPAISADGRYVAFRSLASSLVPEDTNGAADVFVHDRDTGVTERVSVAPDGAQANAASSAPAISADGADVVFDSEASNLVPGDTNGTGDVFVRDLGGSPGLVGTPSVVNAPEGVSVSGRAVFSGATIAGATDPVDDGAAVGPVGATAAGAELTGAALIYRPEQEDLHLRLDLSSLPPAAAGFPGILYGLELTASGTSYQVRALRTAATAVPPRVPSVALYRCAPECAEHAPLTGSIGTTGEQVLVSVPLSALEASEGTELTGLRAFTALGEATPGALVPLDEVPLPSSVVPSSRVELGIAPASTPEDQVDFGVDADLLSGDFSGTVPTTGLSPGRHRVWARACLGDVCGPAEYGEVEL